MVRLNCKTQNLFFEIIFPTFHPSSLRRGCPRPLFQRRSFSPTPRGPPFPGITSFFPSGDGKLSHITICCLSGSRGSTDRWRPKALAPVPASRPSHSSSGQLPPSATSQPSETKQGVIAVLSQKVIVYQVMISPLKTWHECLCPYRQPVNQRGPIFVLFARANKQFKDRRQVVIL